MNIKHLVIVAMLAATALESSAQVALDSVGRKADYVQTIVQRAQKNVDNLALTDSVVAQNVTNIIANRYFLLSDLQEKYGQNKDKTELNAELYKHHFEFPAALANYLTDSQIEQVKDGMTYGVVPKTYQAHLEMIPTLKEEEKLQILNWLKEAREFALDASTSKEKHGWFGKYKGRINNWLSARGYDLVKEREAWYKRIEAQKK